MAQTDAAGRKTWASKETITSALLNAWGDGDQADMEIRMEAQTLNGVESGSALSISSTNIVIAAGHMWCEGKHYVPANSTIAFSASDAADTYYLYVDPTNDTTPYQKATSAPGDGYLLLGQVAWDGASVLSGLVDYKRMGLVYHEIHFSIPGTLTAGDDDNKIYGGSDGRSFWIEGVKGLLENTGAAGSNLVSVYVGAGGSEAAIWATGSRRVTLAALATYRSVASGGEPEQNRTVAAGEVIRARIDQKATGAADFKGVVFGRLV